MMKSGVTVREHRRPTYHFFVGIAHFRLPAGVHSLGNSFDPVVFLSRHKASGKREHRRNQCLFSFSCAIPRTSNGLYPELNLNSIQTEISNPKSEIPNPKFLYKPASVHKKAIAPARIKLDSTRNSSLMLGSKTPCS